MGGGHLRVVARARTGVQPKSVRVSPDGTFVVVCNFGQRNHESVTFHDARTLERIGVVEFEGNAVESAFSPDGATLYVSNFHRHVIEVIDVETRTLRSEISVGMHPKTIRVSRDGSILYVANWGGREVSIVDARRGIEIRRVRTGDNPRGLAVTPEGRLLVASFNSHFIQEFDSQGTQLLRRFHSCHHPRDLVLGSDPNNLFVSCTLGSISWYDLRSSDRIGVGSVGRNPRTLDISSDGRWLVTANFGHGPGQPGSVSVIDLENHTHQSTPINRANRLVGLSLHPGPDLLIYATSWETSEIISLTR